MLAGRERILEVEDGVAAVLDLPQRLEVAQQDVTEPLRVHARDPPLLGLLVLQPAGLFTDENGIAAAQVARVLGTC